ncbi:MAG: aldo/keto reductase [Bacteroidota bacterium]|jgi:aryl-alcohol dehydrogenase-like predicted oxidoreductase
MEYRTLGKTGWNISAISFGAWAIGSAWGTVNDKDSLAALHRALDLGVTFFDTADVYGDGRSERLLAQLRQERTEKFFIATKAGRRLDPHTTGGYSKKNLTAFIERSLRNLNTDVIDLLQLHCPPTEVYYMPEVFGILDELVQRGKIKFYGVSVEKVEEAIKAIEYPNIQSVQIIYNIFRQRPAELFFHEAQKRNIGILARLPLSSGMLTGKLSKQSTFEKDDHRLFNRHGEAFDRGETFSGVDYDLALEVVEQIRPFVPAGMTMTQFALKWILMNPAVTCAIPGAKNPKQAEENIKSIDIPPLPDSVMKQIKDIYNESVRQLVHQYW